MDTNIEDKARLRAADMKSDSGRAFMELSSIIDGRAGMPAADAALKICVVTNEMVAFHKNGGLGTATTGLVETLLRRGFRVSVIYTAWLDLNDDQVRGAIAEMRSRGIDFQLIQAAVPEDWMASPRKISYACYWELRHRPFDVVHFNDYLGNGYYTALARHTGTALASTVVITTVHGPTRWAMGIDERPIGSPAQQEICFLEERTLEYSDVVLGVSHHLLKWLRQEGVNLPRHAYVHKNIMPGTAEIIMPRHLRPGQLHEVVFFARQDVRKGFTIMLDTIRMLAPLLPHVKFTFLGKFSRIAGEHSGALALDRLKDVPNLIGFRHNLDRDGALRYLRRPGVLAVIPSTDENSPCTVFECIVEGIPFIASRVGGVPELIAERDHAKTLFEPNAAALATKIQDVAENGLDDCGLAFDPTAVSTHMLQGFAALHATIVNESAEQASSVAAQAPLVSVVVTHFNRPEYLAQALAAIENQTYPNIEIVVVDDGSTKTAAIAYIGALQHRKCKFPLKVVRTPNRYLGAARNAGVNRAEGVFVKFQDDDNLPLPHEVEYFVRAALTTKADVVTGMSRFFRNESELESDPTLASLEYFPLGASLPLSLAHNEYGDANALVCRQSFIEDGGFTELHGVGSEDYEFFIRAESGGRKIVFVPEILFNYRVSNNSMLQSTSTYRGAKRARSGLRIRHQRWLRELIDFAHEAQMEQDINGQAWYRAGDRRFGDIHRRMLHGEPDSPANIEGFLELAAKYGRLEDVVHMVLGQNTLFDALQWLEKSARSYEEATYPGREFLKKRPHISKFNAFTDIELIEPTEDLPTTWAIHRVEKGSLLVHPMSNRVTKVLVARCIPAGAKKIAVKFSHRNVLGGKVRMGMAVRLDGVQLAESGWVDVQPGGEASGHVVLDHPAAAEADLVLMSTIEGKQDFAWCFADHLSIEHSL